MEKRRIWVTIIVLLIVSKAFSQVSYTATGSLHHARWLHQSQLMPDGKVILFGGENGDYLNVVAYKSAEIYNPSTGTWSLTADMSAIRYNFASAVLPNGDVLAIGGQSDVFGKETAACEVYNPATGAWSAAANMHAARSMHNALQLLDGRVLVAGGISNNTAELYDPSLNTWSLTGSLNKIHGEGTSMVMLASGKVLITGGAPNFNVAEIYDPISGIWTELTDTLKQKRYYHSAVLLNNGNVLISGGSSSESCELFDPATLKFTATGSIFSAVGSSKTIKMDDGNVLLCWLGDIFNATDTQFLQIYNVATGTWSKTGTYTQIGFNRYTIDKLAMGKILISGGNITTGNGANNSCMLITQEAFSGCAVPNLNINVTSNSVCYGRQPVLNLNASENGVNYTAYINSNNVSASKPGGGAISLTLNSDQLLPGINNVKIRVQKAGCTALYLTNNVLVNVTQGNIGQAQVTPAGEINICAGTSQLLTSSVAPNGAGYLWNTGEATAGISVTKNGYYAVRFKDANGCLGPLSATVHVNIVPPSSDPVDAGADKLICITTTPFQLEGTPVKGVWKGKFISPSGLFDPAVAGPGAYTMVYTYCGISDTMVVSVSALTDIPDFSITYSPKSFCYGDKVTVKLTNTITNVNYELYRDDIKIGTPQAGGDNLNWEFANLYSTAHIKVFASQWGVCGDFSKTKFDTITMNPSPLWFLNPVSEAVCFGDIPKVKINASEAGVKYVACNAFNNQPLSDTAAGNGSVLVFPLKDNNGKNYDMVLTINAVNEYGCRATLNNNPITKAWHNIINFKSSVAGAFVGDTITFSNISDASSYTWNIDGVISTKLNPAPVSFNTVGIKKITLIGHPNNEACADTVTHTVEIGNKTPASGGSVCQFDTLQLTAAQEYWAYAFHVDKSGNSYLSSNSYFSGGSYGLTFNKYNNKGKLLWQKQHNNDVGSGGFGGFHSNFITAIKTDNANNIYAAGSFGGESWSWDIINIRYFMPKTTPYLIKLNPEGEVQWIIISSPSTLPYNTIGGFTDIIYLDDNNIYVSIYNPYDLKFTDGKIVDTFNGSQLAVIKINKDGKYLNGFSSAPFEGGKLNSFSNPDFSSMSPLKAASLSPKLLMTSTGKILVSGKSDGMIMFDTLTYNTSENSTGFIAILDTVNGWEKVFKTISCRNMRWPSKFGATQVCTIDAADNIYISEPVTPDYSPFEPNKINIGGIDSIVLTDVNFTAKFNLQGKLQWYNCNRFMIPKSMVALPNEILLYGYYDGFSVMNSQAGPSHSGIKSKGETDALLASFSTGGKVNWLETIGSDTADYPYFMVKDRCDDKVYLSGLTKYKSSFKANKLDLPFSYSFIAKYADNLNCTSQNCPDCYGVKNGTAFIDSCKKCAGGTTGIVPVLNSKLCANSGIGNKKELQQVLIYPNPSSGQLYIRAQEVVKVISISNSLGEIVFSADKFTDNKNPVIDVTFLPSAIYMLKVKSENEEYNNKIFIVK